MPITFTSISRTGYFVPNRRLTVLRKPGKKLASKPLDCHLMVTRPQDYIAQLARAGADLSLASETINVSIRLIDENRRRGMKVGLILNPETPVEAMKYYIQRLIKLRSRLSIRFCWTTLHS